MQLFTWQTGCVLVQQLRHTRLAEEVRQSDGGRFIDALGVAHGGKDGLARIELAGKEVHWHLALAALEHQWVLGLSLHWRRLPLRRRQLQ